MPSKPILGTLWSKPATNGTAPPVLPGPAKEPEPLKATPAASPLRPLEAADVFIAGGRPNLTMIDRSQTATFAAVAAQVRRRGRVISLHGESKSGKTILCLQIFRDKLPIEIHAREAKTLDAFWVALRNKLRMPIRHKVTEDATREGESELSVEGSLEAKAFGLKGKVSPAYSATCHASHGVSRTEEFGAIPNGQIIDVLVRDEAVIIIDDFHWIAEDVQGEILRDLRPFLLRNGTLVVISVPERAEQILAHDHEMSALCTVIEAPSWELDDIAAIGRKGFTSLNVGFDDIHIRKLAAISHHNPMLMQEACYQLCCHFKVQQRQTVALEAKVTPLELRAIFRATAKQQSRPQYRQLAEGKAPKTWRTKSGVDVTIYTLCLLGMRHIGFKQEIGLDKLIERIGRIVGPRDKSPDRGTVKRALQQLSSDMIKALGDNAPMEYDPKTERVYFLDPFFMTYIQWVLAPEVGEPEPAIW